MIAGLESLGFSRTEIARGAQVSRTTVFRLAVGDARLPSFQTIERLQQFEQRAVTDMKQR